MERVRTFVHMVKFGDTPNPTLILAGQTGGGGQARSSAMAIPWPTPMHIVARP